MSTSKVFTDQTSLQWQPEQGWTPVEASNDISLLVVDSWLLEDGRVRGLDLHWQRFEGYAISHGIAEKTLAAFRQATTTYLPRKGLWFPRVELVQQANGAYSLRLLLRENPSLNSKVDVWILDKEDPRKAPQIKGPDLELTAKLRKELELQLTTELLFVNKQQQLLEGSYSSLLWWQGDTLYAPPLGSNILPSVTRQLILQLATEEVVEIKLMYPTLEDLSGAEIWLVNALHGIRSVKSCLNRDLECGQPRLAQSWQAKLKSLA